MPGKAVNGDGNCEMRAVDVQVTILTTALHCTDYSQMRDRQRAFGSPRFKSVNEFRRELVQSIRFNRLAREQFLPNDEWFRKKGMTTWDQKEQVAQEEVTQEWNNQLDTMLEEGQYEHTVADFLLPAMCDLLGVNILTFNTNRETGGNSPLLLCRSDVYGGPSSDLPPILLAYDGSHYESLLPASTNDEILTKNLVTEISDNNFIMKYEAINSVFHPRQGVSWANQEKHMRKKAASARSGAFERKPTTLG